MQEASDNNQALAKIAEEKASAKEETDGIVAGLEDAMLALRRAVKQRNDQNATWEEEAE